MLPILNKTHQDYFTNLLTCSIPNHFDYRAGQGLLFLFPYYIQVGLSQILLTLEEVILEDFKLTQSNLIDPYKSLQLTFNLLGRELSPITQSLIQPKLDVTEYNNMFGLDIPNSVFFKNTITQVKSMGLLGQGSLYSTQDSLLPRERLEKFFNLINFEMDNLDLVIDIIINNDRIKTAAIFCNYFQYPIQLTQQVIDKVEQWLLDN
jgi:hypothetical protein